MCGRKNITLELSGGSATPAPRDHTWLIRALFGQRHWCVPWIIQLCKADAAFFAHLTEQDKDYPHFLCLLRLAPDPRASEFLDMKSFAEQAQQIRTGTRRRLVRHLYGECAPALLTVLKRLGTKPLSRTAYRNLLELRTDTRTLRHLAHRSVIRGTELEVVSRLPPELRRIPAIRRIRRRTHAQLFLYLIDMARVLRPDLDERKLARSLRSMRDLKQLLRWVRRQLDRVEFAAPPWEGNDWVRPVQGVADLRTAARRFENCAMQYVEDVLERRVYFYLSERGPALITIRKDPFLGWCLDEYRGPKNKKLPRPLARSLLDVFTAAGIPRPRGWEAGHHLLVAEGDNLDIDDWLPRRLGRYL